MEPNPPPENPFDRIERACDRYEAAWREESGPRIEDFLDEVTEEERPGLLRELLALDLELHRCRGEKLTVRDYLDRFPEHTEIIGSIFQSTDVDGTPAGEEGSPPGEILPSTIDGNATPFAPPGSYDPTFEHRNGVDEGPPSLTAPYLSEDENRVAETKVADPTTKPWPPRKISRYEVIRPLGQGGFGHVFLARDEGLDRLVAVKVPRAGVFPTTRQVEEFLSEARSAACLRHPSIVAVHDMGHQEDGTIFVVMEYIEGTTLSDLLRHGRPPLKRIVELLIQVALAVHHAHRRGLVHRDLKPANILVDAEGHALVTDFGLAINENTQRLRAGEIAGTPTHMAPEQVRGETHRLDGRTDVWGLGVICYQAMTGRPPFTGSRGEIFDQILNREPRPPRQIDDSIPAELERICLKCLMPRMTERYNTAADLAEDLKHWLDHEAEAASARNPTPVADGPEPSVPVIPKGLRAFDSGDADFFLELLPGPRDRDGLPEILRFWKSRIEETDPEKAFSVGLIYGTSGSGKSSLVKAGLLPRLHQGVKPFFIEATPNDTESRLLGALRRGFPDLPGTLDLAESLAVLRDEPGVARDRKVLLILDQFEQWLYAHPEGHASGLVQAFRQCDGRRVQCIILVRDDFWMAITRFMRDLEVPVREGWNSAAVELFDPIHARKVLARFGAAFGRLAVRPEELSPVQVRFLDQAISGLKRQDGRIVPVRLSLFAEMIRGRPWVPATIKDVGGAEGIGVAFLEETFSASSAPPVHRYHQEAARSLLRALLPGQGAAIKGRMRSVRSLREAAGYEERPADFAELLRILDTELRLVTPTDREERRPNEAGAASEAPGEVCYQLTHDDLVPSIRDWLTRKQRETRRGRAEIRLAERATLWQSRPETRLLPSFCEWMGIRWLTRPEDWTEPERRMMKAAARRHLRNAAAAAGVAAVLAVVALALRARIRDDRQSRDADALVERLLVAEYAEAPRIVRQIRPYRDRLGPRLAELAESSPRESKTRLLANLALLDADDDPRRADELAERILTAGPVELSVLREALQPFNRRAARLFWDRVLDPGTGWQPRLRAACALAGLDPGAPSWAEAASKVAFALVREDRLMVPRWMELLRPVRFQISPAFRALYLDRGRSAAERSIAASVLAEYLRDAPYQIGELILDADAESFRLLLSRLSSHPGPAIARLEQELAREPEPRWDDVTLDGLPDPDGELIAQIEASEGLFAGRFAICQTLPMERFEALAEGLRPAGYRPIAFRPYRARDRILVAGAWARDGLEWKMARDRTSEEIRDLDRDLREEGFLPVDLACYPAGPGAPLVPGAGEPYAALWVRAGLEGRESALPDLLDARMYVGVPEDRHEESWRPLLDAGFAPRTGFVVERDDGGLNYSSIRWRLRDRPRDRDTWSDADWDQIESAVDRRADLALLPVDVRFSRKNDRNEVRYATVWWAGCADEAKELHGLAPGEHLRRCRKLAEAGYRPSSIAADVESSPDGGAPAIVTASVWRRPIASEAGLDSLARRQANAAVALLHLRRPDHFWSAMRHREDPRLRSSLIERVAPLEVESRVLLDRLRAETDVSARRALILALAAVDPSRIAPILRDEGTARLWSLHGDDPDPGVHSAVEYLLRRWGHGEELARRRDELRGRHVPEGQRWFVDRAGHTMAILPGPLSFTMGSPGHERPRDHYLEMLHPLRIERTIAVATEEVTVEQYHEFDPHHSYDAKFSLSRDCPVNMVSWFDAARYCNALSAKAKIPREQWCYPEPVGPGMPLPDDATRKLGYRLPTEAEWEYFCRADSRTVRPFGHSEALLSRYAWTVANSQDHAWPVGLLLPNDFGVFDVLGNAWEWCHERFVDDPHEYPRGEASVDGTNERSMRGGSFLYIPSTARSAHRDSTRAARRVPYLGIRVVRTLPREPWRIFGQGTD